MDNTFRLNNKDLELFAPSTAIEFIQDLLWTEAFINNIPLTKIIISKNIFTPDGGIDASIDQALPINDDIIKKGFTGYQIKTGGNFIPTEESSIRKELFKNKRKYNKQNLAKEVSNCLEKNGTYVLICFGQDLTNAQTKKSIQHLNKYFKLCGFTRCKIQVWSQNNLLSFVSKYPSISLRYSRYNNLQYQSFKSWSTDAEMLRLFVAGIEQTNFIKDINKLLLQNNSSIHIRIWGEPGIGKTRLVMESLRAEFLSPLVVYCSSPSYFKDSLLMNELQKEDNNFQIILVVDECDSTDRTYIWDKLKYRATRIKLITITHEYDNSSGEIRYLMAPRLDDKNIAEIIERYNVPRDHAERWADFCSGSPRVAHVFGQNISTARGLLTNLDTVEVWERYIIGLDDKNSILVNQRRIVLQHVALFKKFGFERDIIKEAKTISKMVERVDPNITWSKFLEIIKGLKSRKILQGEYTLYITPKALHIKLWSDYWETYGIDFSINNFLDSLSPSLQNWLFEMFRYATESNVASKIVEDLLGDNGPFVRDDYLRTQLGGRFFLALTEANPKSALRCLSSTIGTWNKNELLNYKESRREIVWALEKIVIWGELFNEGAHILLKLAESENENYSNNATGIFIGLFSAGYGRAASTELSPNKRFIVLLEALNSSLKEIRMIAYSACTTSLETQHFSSFLGAEYQGLKEIPQLWQPSNYSEVYNYYKLIWTELEKRIDDFEPDESLIIINILLSNSRGLIVIEELAEMVINTFASLSNNNSIVKKELIPTITTILHFEKKHLSGNIIDKLESLNNSVTGSDFSSQLRRHIGMDLVEDEFDEKTGEESDTADRQIKELASFSLENKDDFKKELHWLLTDEAKKGFDFGFKLGKLDKYYSLLPDLLNALRINKINRNGFLIGGYFRAIYERNINKWEIEINKVTADKDLINITAEIIFRSGLTDNTALLLLHLVDIKVVSVKELKLFAYGSLIVKVSLIIFKKWIEFIIKSDDKQAGSIAITLCNHYFLRKENITKFDPQLIFKVITHKTLFSHFPQSYYDPMDEYYWTELGKVLVNKHKFYSIRLGKILFRSFGTKGNILKSTVSKSWEVINTITKDFPREIWKIIIKYLGPPIDERAFYLYHWLNGGGFEHNPNGMLTFIPFEDICKWVDNDIENRAWYIAFFVPSVLFRRENELCYAREVLVKYGTREDVRINLIANFSNEVWTGKASHHYQDKKDMLLEYRELESDKNVIHWLDEYVFNLDERIRHYKIIEEREIF